MEKGFLDRVRDSDGMDCDWSVSDGEQDAVECWSQICLKLNLSEQGQNPLDLSKHKENIEAASADLFSYHGVNLDNSTMSALFEQVLMNGINYYIASPLLNDQAVFIERHTSIELLTLDERGCPAGIEQGNKDLVRESVYAVKIPLSKDKDSCFVAIYVKQTTEVGKYKIDFLPLSCLQKVN